MLLMSLKREGKRTSEPIKILNALFLKKIEQ